MPIVQIITTGGTIAHKIDPATGAALPTLSGEELVAEVPALAGVAQVRVAEFALLQSWNMTPSLAADLARRVRDALADPEVSGVVVTHGTDTMEETSFALDLVLDTPRPIVFTGAMRNPSQPGPDGPRNVVSAARVATDPAARDLGVLVVLNDEIHAARYVTKGHTTALHTFVSRGVGPLGLVDDEGVWVRWRPARLPRLPLVDPAPHVYLIKMAAGTDDLFLRSALDAAARGVVIEGSGAGHTPATWEPAIGALVQAGVPVVLVSRTGSGRVAAIYGGAGGGRSLRALGVVPGGDLTGPKARVALAFALGAGMDMAAIRDYFSHAGNGVGAYGIRPDGEHPGS